VLATVFFNQIINRIINSSVFKRIKILNQFIMSQKHIVSIQPQEVPQILSESEMNQLTNLIDKLLVKGVKLKINYKSYQKWV